MDPSIAWRYVDAQRAELADLIEWLDGRDPALWETPSLCAGWTVRNVAAHLTHSTLGMPRMLVEAARSGFRFNAVVDRMAVADARSPHLIAENLRAVVGSRRHPPGTTVMEPLIDALVHAQDICVPLGIDRVMPVDAAVAAAERVWHMGFPFHARKRLAGVRLVATDADFAEGQGREIAAPVQELLMTLTGRSARLAEAG